MAALEQLHHAAAASASASASGASSAGVSEDLWPPSPASASASAAAAPAPKPTHTSSRLPSVDVQHANRSSSSLSHSSSPAAANTPSTPSSSASSAAAASPPAQGRRNTTRAASTSRPRRGVQRQQQQQQQQKQSKRRAPRRTHEHTDEEEEKAEAEQERTSSASPSEGSGAGDAESCIHSDDDDDDDDDDDVMVLRPVSDVVDEDELPTPEASPSGSSPRDANSVIHCGRVNEQGEREYRQRSAFFSTTIDIGGGESTVAQQQVNVYTCDRDGHQRTLYCCGDLAKRFECSSQAKRMNKVGMWMSRRRNMPGVFQAKAILHKQLGPHSKVGLKTSGYFFTLDVAQKYQTHVINRRKNSPTEPIARSPTERMSAAAAAAKSQQGKGGKHVGAGAGAVSPSNYHGSSSSHKRALSAQSQSASSSQQHSSNKSRGVRKESPGAAASASRSAKRVRRSAGAQDAQLHTSSEPESPDDHECDGTSSSSPHPLDSVSSAAGLVKAMGALATVRLPHSSLAVLATALPKPRRLHRKMPSVEARDRSAEVNSAYASALPVMAQIIGQPPLTARSTSAGFSVPVSPASASSMPMTLAQPRAGLALPPVFSSSTPSATRVLSQGSVQYVCSSKSEGALRSSPSCSSSSSASVVGAQVAPLAPLPHIQPQSMYMPPPPVTVKLEVDPSQQAQTQAQAQMAADQQRGAEAYMMQMQSQSVYRPHGWMQAPAYNVHGQPMYASLQSSAHSSPLSSASFSASSSQSHSLYFHSPVSTPTAHYAFGANNMGRMTLPMYMASPQLSPQPQQLPAPMLVTSPPMPTHSVLGGGGGTAHATHLSYPMMQGMQPYGVYMHHSPMVQQLQHTPSPVYAAHAGAQMQMRYVHSPPQPMQSIQQSHAAGVSPASANGTSPSA